MHQQLENDIHSLDKNYLEQRFEQLKKVSDGFEEECELRLLERFLLRKEDGVLFELLKSNLLQQAKDLENYPLTQDQYLLLLDSAKYETHKNLRNIDVFEDSELDMICWDLFWVLNVTKQLRRGLRNRIKYKRKHTESS